MNYSVPGAASGAVFELECKQSINLLQVLPARYSNCQQASPASSAGNWGVLNWSMDLLEYQINEFCSASNAFKSAVNPIKFEIKSARLIIISLQVLRTAFV